MAERLAGRLRAAAQCLECAQARLLAAAPQDLDICAGQMELACEVLAGVSLEAGCDGGREQALPAALELRAKILAVRRLLDKAWRFYQQWGKFRVAAPGGYLVDGQAAPPGRSGRVSLRA